MPYGPAVDLLSLDSMQRVSLEVSSNDELLCDAHAGSNCANGNGLPQMVIRDFICDKVKEELAKASEDHSETNCEGNSGITASSDQKQFGQLENGAQPPRVDVGYGIASHGQASVECAVYEGEGESSSGEEDATTSVAATTVPKHYVVQKILDKRVIHGEVLLLTKWKGYRMPDWQPYKNFDKTNEALMAFELKNASSAADSTDGEEDN
ncbi:hypothetical protein AAVH_14991 [Aphelenchoides avenae]|nr:hypothetical protein AAVH_14991 [Aphelenchus avenae]